MSKMVAALVDITEYQLDSQLSLDTATELVDLPFLANHPHSKASATDTFKWKEC